MGDMSREPSMEDILSSIRRVIARDEATVQARMSRVQPAGDGAQMTEQPNESMAEKLDLHTVEKITMPLHDHGPSAHAAPPEQTTTPSPPAGAAPTFAAQPSPGSAQTLNDTLISNASAEAARQSLESLNTAFALSPNLAAAGVSSPARTIDDVVMEALRPMLKTWLDQNLPPIVEAMVAKEIRRITGQR